MPDLKHFNSKRVKIDFGDSEFLHVRYKQQALTLSIVRRVAESAEEDKEASKVKETASAAEVGGETAEPSDEKKTARALRYATSLRDSLLAVIVDWDLTNGPDPVALTAESLDSVDIALLRTIWDTLVEAQRPDPTKPATSSNT